MNIGTLVYHQHSHGNLRLGTITEKDLDKKGWAHYAVDWHDDGCHVQATDWQTKMRNDGVDRYNRTYRSDELGVVDVKHLEKATAAHHLLKDYRPVQEAQAC